MKRIAVNLTCSLLSLAVGLTAASLWNWNKNPVKSKQPSISISTDVRPLTDSTASIVNFSATATPDREDIFGEGLRIAPDQVQLKSERLRYEIDVSYPQIIGSEDLHIRKLNQRMKKLATDQYSWPMNPSKADLRYYRDKHPEAFNTINLDYEVLLATDSLLSIYFIGYSYGIGAAHSVQYSFVVNYDLTLRKELKLSDIFKHRSKYLDFICHYCLNKLSTRPEYSPDSMFKEALAPEAEDFKSWNITSNGIRFNFDACKVFGCAGGKQEVEIPFTALKQLLNHEGLKMFT